MREILCMYFKTSYMPVHSVQVRSVILGTQHSTSLGAKKPVPMQIIPFRGFPRTRNFLSWTSVKSPKVSVLVIPWIKLQKYR